MAEPPRWLPDSQRPRTGPQRRAGEYPAASPTGDVAAKPSIAEETSQVEALVEMALAAALAKQSKRRDLDDERKELAEMSVQLTTARSISRRYKLATALSTSILAGIGIMSGTCLATWQDAKHSAVVPAQEAEATARTLADRVDANEAQLEQVDTTLRSIAWDVGVLGRKLDRILDEQPERSRR